MYFGKKCGIILSMANRSILVFIIFMIHALADAWHLSQQEVYAILKKSGALDEYLIPHYEVLHTLGAEYLVEDLTDCVRERGISI